MTSDPSSGKPCDAERHGSLDRLARRLDLEARRGDRPADALGGLEGLLRGRLGQQDRELLAAEARRHVVVAKLRAEDVRDALQDRVAREMAVRVVDVPEQIEVGHDHGHRTLEAFRACELLAEHRGEVPGVEETRLRIDAGLLLKRRHAQRAVDEEERCDRERDQPGIDAPEGRDRDPEAGEDESVESDSNVKIESGLWPRARGSMIANPTWFTTT